MSDPGNDFFAGQQYTRGGGDPLFVPSHNPHVVAGAWAEKNRIDSEKSFQSNSYNSGVSSSGSGIGGIILIGIILFVGWAVISGDKKPRSHQTKPEAAADQAGQTSGTLPDNSMSASADQVSPPPLAPSAPQDQSATTNPSAESNQASPDSSTTGATVVWSTLPLDETFLPELEASARQALDSGSTTSWSAPGQSLTGYISVSSAQEYPDRVCRNYRYTVVRSNVQIGGNEGAACKGADGNWRPSTAAQ